MFLLAPCSSSAPTAPAHPLHTMSLVCRDYWIQIDVDPAFPISQPVAPPLPRVPAAGGQPPADQQPPQYETVGGEAGKPPKAV